MDFTVPSDNTGGDKFSAAEHEGMLCLFIDHVKDTFEGDWGPTEIAACGLIIVLDHPDGPSVFEDAWVFGAALAPSINRANGSVLATIGKEKSKNGRDTWVLVDPTKTQVKAATKWSTEYLEQLPTGNFKYLGDSAPF